jgi:glycosyltransferase involved in cell wall biosynthesis
MGCRVASNPRRSRPVTNRSRVRVLMVAPRVTDEGGITRAVHGWLAAGLTDRVDVDVVRMAAWDDSLCRQCLQTVSGLSKIASQVLRSSQRPDIVHVHASSGGSLYRKYLSSWLARRAGVPVLVHLHSGGFEDWIGSRRIHRVTAERLFRLASGVVVVAEVWRDLARNLGASHVYVVPHLLTPRLAQILTTIESGPRLRAAGPNSVTILYYGRWAPIKGLDVLAAAVRMLPPHEQQRLRLRIFGNGDSDWVRERFRDTELEVTIGGWLPDDRKPDELKAADAVVLPSRSEAFGASLLEVMAAGTPIIASTAGAIPEVLADYPLACLTRVGDPADLGYALRALLEGRWPGTRAREPLLPARYSAAAVLDALVDAYHHTIRSAAPARC